MANKKLDDVRSALLHAVECLFNEQGFDVQRTGSQELALPIVSNDHEEEGWLVINFKIPKGSRDGEAYDGYSMAEDYKLKQEAKEAKAKAAAEKKAAKIAKDKKAREDKAKAKSEKAGQ